MKRIILVRHAKAAKDDGRGEDRDRPLNERGQRDAPEMGRRLAQRGVMPDLIVSSPATRAIETAKHIARELDFPWKDIRREPRIYAADAGTLLDVIRENGRSAEIAMFVGHNPGLADLAQLLARDFHVDLPTCAVVALEFFADTWEGVRPGSGNLMFLDYPKK